MSIGEPRRFAASAGDMSFLDVGHGPLVVLVHGFPLSALMWRAIAPMLAPRFRVIVPDLLGSGASDQPVGAPLDPQAQAGYLRELLAHLGVDRYAVVAHGTGGIVAQVLAVDGAGVEAMVLLDAPIIGEALSAMSAAMDGADDPGVAVPALFDAGARQRARISEDIVAAYAGSFQPDSGGMGRAAQALEGGPSDRAADLAEIGYPVLLLWGEDDPFVPVSVAERLNERMPSSTLGLLPGCGHFLVEEASDTIAPLILEYLRAMYLRAPHGHPDEKPGVVMLQLERRPPWVDLAEDEADDWFVDDDDDEEGDRG